MNVGVHTIRANATSRRQTGHGACGCVPACGRCCLVSIANLYVAASLSLATRWSRAVPKRLKEFVIG